MPIPTLPTPPAAPSRTDDTPAEFVTNADAFVTWLETFGGDLNDWATAVAATVSGVDFNGTSATSLAIGTGSKTLTTQTGKLWNIGQFVIIADSSNPANYMGGQVTAYNSGTGALTVNVTATGGSGTIAAWSVGISPDTSQKLPLAGGTLTGLLTTLASATGSAGLNVPPGTAPTSPNNGDEWATSAGRFLRLAGATHEVVLRTLDQTLTKKTLEDPILSKALTETAYTITDGAAFEVDPSNGTVQKVTLGASRTPKATNFGNGESILLLIDDGAARTLTWTDATWGGSGVKWLGPYSGGGSAPVLGTTGYTWVVLTKYSGQVYGQHAGYSA